MAYSYAQLGGCDLYYFRLCGPGLGNLLFPWARFVVATRRYGLKPIAPAWPQIKWGPIRRREADKRFYRGLFQTPPGQIGGVRKLLLLPTLRRVSERVLHEMDEDASLAARQVFVFQGLGGYFSPILNDHDYVRAQLLAITRDEQKAGLACDFKNSISVHVRLTDFLPATEEQRLEPEASRRLPISWYRHIVNELRAAAGSDLRVNVFSDGRDDELSPLLTMPNVRRLAFGSSIADLLALSRAGVLVASGSTFSRWASYLGRMPVVWFPGLLGRGLYYDDPGAEVECGPGDRLPRSFTDKLGPKPVPA